MARLDSLDARWLREGARDQAEFEQFMQRRAAGESVHRILGWREFWGLKFHLSSETLEPRPDSETMIEVLLRQIPDANASLRMLDLGTGTGCLLLAALNEFKQAKGIGIDQSLDAIATAQKNAAENNLQSRSEFLQMDWNDQTALRRLGQFNVILCNPPYIPSEDIKNLQSEVKHHDPMSALDGGADGLQPYRYLAGELRHLLIAGGVALFEFGHDQAAKIQDIMQSAGFWTSPAYQDLGGNDRVIIVRAP